MSFEILYIPSGMLIHYWLPNEMTDSHTLVLVSKWFEIVYDKKFTKEAANREIEDIIYNQRGLGRWQNFHQIQLPMLKSDFEIVETSDV